MDLDDLDLMDMQDMQEIEDMDVPERARRRLQRYRERVDPFELEDEFFRYKYRFTKRFASRIVDLVREGLDHDYHGRGNPLSPELQVVCALRNWARHEIQDDTADLHGVSQPVISTTCKRVAESLASMSRDFIKMPDGLGQQEEAMRNFRQIAGFPTVIRAIDCTHIRIKKVEAEGGQLYINRKGFPSINVQVVCNANLKIMDIVARWRGSVHDSRIFRECRLKERFEAGEFSGILIGDSGYPCLPYLMTPVLNPSTPQEERYNESHILTRNRVERCFGVWKQRFRCLLRGMFGDIETAKTTIVACAVLHNIAIDMREDVFPGEEEVPVVPPAVVPVEPPAEEPVVNHNIRGNVRRRHLIETHF